MPARRLAVVMAALLVAPLVPFGAAAVPTTTFEAEDFPTKTTGGRKSSGAASDGEYWNLWSNGYIQRSVTFATTEVAEVMVRARGSAVNGVYARMNVTLDGVPVLDVFVTGSFAWYTSTPRTIDAGTHTLRIRFANDAKTSTQDRNLHADAAKFATTGPPPAAPLEKEAEAFAKKSTGGKGSSTLASGGAYWNLWGNGHIEDTLQGDPAANLTVVARGTPAAGAWPTMVVSVDGNVTGTFSVTSPNFSRYLAPPLPNGNHKVRIAFTNDLKTSTQDRNLHVDVVFSDAGFTLAAGEAVNVSFPWPGGAGFVLAHVGTDPGNNTEPTLEASFEGNLSKAARVAGPVPRPFAAPFEAPNGTVVVRFEAVGGTVLFDDVAAVAGLPPPSVTGAGARIHEGGFAESTGWRLREFGWLETDLLVNDTGWYELRLQGTGTAAAGVGPLVHLWLNRTVVAEGEQDATIDLTARVFLHEGVGYTMGASFENPGGGRSVRFDALDATPSGPPDDCPLLLCLTLLPPNDDPDGWPQYGRDAWNTRANPDPALPNATEAASLGLAWRVQLDGSVTGTPAVAGGRVFVGTWNESLYALDESTGATLWRADLPERVDDSAAVAGGLVLVGVGDTLMAFHEANGTLAWEHEFPGHLWASPIVDEDDVFIGVDGDRGYVARLALQTGTLVWMNATTEVFNTGARVWASPLVVPGSGLVVVGTSPGNEHGQPAEMDALIAYDRDDGERVWLHRFFPGPDTNDESSEAAKILQNRDLSGTPHLALLDGRPVVLASQKHGPAWAVDLFDGTLVHGSRVLPPRTSLIGSGGTVDGLEVVTGNKPNLVAAFDLATGDLRWEQRLPSTTFTPVALGGGLVWVGSWDGKLRAFDLRTGQPAASLDVGGGVLGGAALAHGSIFVGALTIPASNNFNDSLGELPGFVAKWS